MTRKYFGTDGIRGRANGVITPDLALKVGQATGLAFQRGSHRHRVVIGKDTRLSGYMIEYAMVAGFTSVGMDVMLLGPMPTPAVAMLTRSMRADLGVMISASHNPYEDNGIKLFGPDGYKLNDEVEAEISKLIDSDLAPRLSNAPALGRAKRIESAHARYIEFAKRTLPRNMSLEGMRIVIDCANGAGYKVAPEALWELGAEVIAIGVDPDGFNINKDVGSTAPDALIAKVRELRADIGIALDGDADRVLIVDELGQVVDGDQLMAVIARTWQEDGRLSQPGVVATVMSNLGLERYLAGLGLSLARTAVGDRYVLEHMRSQGFNLGGEQSGHIILSDFGTTGDGLVAALQLLPIHVVAFLGVVAMLALQAAATVAIALAHEKLGRLALLEERERIAHDLHFALNYPVHSGSFKFDDTDLRDNDLVRIYDVVIPYSDGLMATDEILREILVQPEFQKEMGTTELHYLIGKYAAEWERKNGLKDVSVMAAAYRAGVPCFTSSPGDSTIGIPAPKSGTVANAMGKIAANAVVHLLNGKQPPAMAPINACYSWVSDREAIAVINSYRIQDGKVVQIEQKLTPGQSVAVAHNAVGWSTSIWNDVLG